MWNVFQRIKHYILVILLKTFNRKTQNIIKISNENSLFLPPASAAGGKFCFFISLQTNDILWSWLFQLCKTGKVGVENVVHCASLCGANEENCKGFLYDVTTMICKLIDFQNLIPKFSLNSFSGFVNYGKYFIALVLPVEHTTCSMVGVPPPPPP